MEELTPGAGDLTPAWAKALSQFSHLSWRFGLILLLPYLNKCLLSADSVPTLADCSGCLCGQDRVIIELVVGSRHEQIDP